ncbi:hypothetical protein ABZ922_09820 [Streptomyces shenzhenensis]|uniref:hypothetical protein n=1 Tax=Streptomyces shenzhenensis TaxID=943815 RepID=UPI0034056058
MSSETVNMPPPEVLDVLGLPDLDSLDEAREAGRVCIWCGEPLTIETAVDLGEQEAEDGTCFPRACRRCVADRAHRGLFAHTPMCDLCEMEATAANCSVGRSLYRLVGDNRR